MKGTVCGHEQNVVEYLQTGLSRENIDLQWVPSSVSFADVYVRFHRTKQRLPQDEIEAMLAQYKGTSSMPTTCFKINIVAAASLLHDHKEIHCDCFAMFEVQSSSWQSNCQAAFSNHVMQTTQCFAGKDKHLVVVFMHNIPTGHEDTMKPVGPNNTDLGCWQQLVQHCLEIVNMSFDERSFQWNAINQQAAARLSQVIQQSAKQNNPKDGSRVITKP